VSAAVELHSTAMPAPPPLNLRRREGKKKKQA